MWTAQDQGAEPNVFASRIDLMISQGENPGHALYEEIAARLAGLLEREPGDALRAELHVSPAEFAGGRTGFCLRLFLFSRAATEEQAELRWNLGLARVQQALLFIARAIRQRRLSLQ